MAEGGLMGSLPIRGSLDLLEEAVHILRRTPPRILFQYFVGTAPFLLALLYFWADMSRGAFSYRYVAEASLGLTALYIWMKAWQSVFCISIHARVMEHRGIPFTFRRAMNILATQAILQPYSLFLLPAAFLALLPFGWVFAFFQNVLVLGSGEDLQIRRIMRVAWQAAKLWPAQNHRLLLILSLFGIIVFLNVTGILLFLPYIIRVLFGVETVFSISGFQMLNTTFFSIVCAITYLCVDPLVCVVYTLRCFYGESLETGADLTAELKSLTGATS
jgi:hypothetical protein